jgi:alkylhydroperoxidase/carboxymuconolactone decarboxylase family protein YurZ
MPDQQTDTPILDLLSAMTESSLEATSLDGHSVMLVRIAALVASGAPPMSYALNLGVAGNVDVDVDEVRGVLAAVAPIVGTARVTAAVGNMVKALALEELAELDEEEEAE